MLLGRYDQEYDEGEYDEKAPAVVAEVGQGITSTHSASAAAAAEPPAKRPLTAANLAATSTDGSSGATAQV